MTWRPGAWRVVMNSSDMLEVIGMSSRVIVMYEGAGYPVSWKRRADRRTDYAAGHGTGKEQEGKVRKGEGQIESKLLA